MDKKSKDRIVAKRLKTQHGRFWDLLIADHEYSVIRDCIIFDNAQIYNYSETKFDNWLIPDMFDWLKQSTIQLPFDNIFLESKFAFGLKGQLIRRIDEKYLSVTSFIRPNDSGQNYVFTSVHVELDEESRFLSDKMVVRRMPDNDQDYDYYSACDLFVALLTVQMINKNEVESIDHIPQPDISRECQKHFGQPLAAYKTLRIKPMGKQYDSSDSKDYQGLMPLHLRRGNFAHYTEDAPLFGKYTGTFWRPATAVGESKNGTVVKDYKVMAE